MGDQNTGYTTVALTNKSILTNRIHWSQGCDGGTILTLQKDPFLSQTGTGMQ